MSELKRYHLERDMPTADFYLCSDIDPEIAKLKTENKAHRQVAINIQDTLDKSSIQYRDEIAKLKEERVCECNYKQIGYSTGMRHWMDYCPYCGSKIKEVVK